VAVGAAVVVSMPPFYITALLEVKSFPNIVTINRLATAALFAPCPLPQGGPACRVFRRLALGWLLECAGCRGLPWL